MVWERHHTEGKAEDISEVVHVERGRTVSLRQGSRRPLVSSDTNKTEYMWTIKLGSRES